VGLLSALLRPEDIVFSDSANHASLIDGIRLAKCRRVIFPHLDLNFLEDELQRTASVAGARVVVVESIFSMEGDRAPLADLAALAGRYGAELIVDEAHAIGVRGPHGSGCVAEAGLSARVLATVHTCGKALAAAGAFVCGSGNLRRFLINRARTFIFNTGLPPYFASQIAAAISLAAEADNERANRARYPWIERCRSQFCRMPKSKRIRRSRDSSAHGTRGNSAAPVVPHRETFRRSPCRPRCRNDASS
jgi:7-keto-8-aminopelargonate synthetase-like enzyme